MSHRKIRSQLHVPFSWEEKPGVPKLINHLNSLEIRSDQGRLITSTSHELKNIAPPPPPPCTSSRRGFSVMGLWWEDDPFLAALRSCTKRVSNARGDKELRKKGSDSNKVKSLGSVFSCKKSCNVENDNLVKFSKLPPIPKERYSAKSFVKNSHY